jgi:3-hydroxybutyryl-CoA dehydratase
MPPGHGFDEVEPGQLFESRMTMTETHVVLGAGLFGDFNPLHVDPAFAAKSRFGGRIAHGYLTSSAMAAPLGMIFHGTAIAYLEHACRFTAPVRPGDTLEITWTVVGRMAKPRLDGGIVKLSCQCRNQDGVEVANADAALLVANRRR